jgi:hypothetical protein
MAEVLYRILLGSKEFVKQCEDNIDDELLKKKLEEMRIRIGTLLKTDNVSFLFGAGASIPAGGVSLKNIPLKLEKLLVDKALQEQKDTRPPMWIEVFYDTTSVIAKRSFSFEERSLYLKDIDLEDTKSESIPVNLEDYLSHLYMWLEGMKGNQTIHYLSDDKSLTLVRNALDRLIKEITGTLISLLHLPLEGKQHELNVHRKFIKKVLTRPLNLRRTNIFTLNYDTLIEQAADAEGVLLVDGFVGTLRRVFRPESYDVDFYFPAQTTEGHVHRFDRALHLYKLHGSLSWRSSTAEWENPYGLYSTISDENQPGQVVIYPSPLKYGQALSLPYSELFRRFGNAIVQPQSVLFAIGYGFGDEHVNAIIRQALAVPSFTLVVIDPYPNDFVKKLESLKDERIWTIIGSKLGRFDGFVDHLLPDLRDEEIERRVIRTYNELIKQDDSKEGSSDGDK